MHPVSELTFVLGLPVAHRRRRELELFSAVVDRPLDELWIELVREVMDEFAKRRTTGTRSVLDEILIDAIGAEIRVQAPTVIATPYRCPAATIDMRTAVWKSPEPRTADWERIAHTVGAVFARALGADWVRPVVIREPRAQPGEDDPRDAFAQWFALLPPEQKRRFRVSGSSDFDDVAGDP